MGGRDQSERPVAISWNGWSQSPGALNQGDLSNPKLVRRQLPDPNTGGQRGLDTSLDQINVRTGQLRLPAAAEAAQH